MFMEFFNHFATTKAQKNVWACLPVKVNRIEGTTFITSERNSTNLGWVHFCSVEFTATSSF